jgi:hypothetical protein
MIAQDEESSKRLFAKYLAIGRLKTDPSQTVTARSIAMSGFPGALVPALDDDSVVFVAAVTSAVWERIMPLLHARIGLTLSDFTGIPSPITVIDPVASFLVTQSGGILSQIRLSPNEVSRRAAWAALARLVENIEQYAARLDFAVPTSSASIALSGFECAVDSGDVTKAQQLLDAMAENRQIDALNRHFLQVRLFALAGAWESIINSGLYETLQHVRVPVPVKDALDMARLRTSP